MKTLRCKTVLHIGGSTRRGNKAMGQGWRHGEQEMMIAPIQAIAVAGSQIWDITGRQSQQDFMEESLYSISKSTEFRKTLKSFWP